MWNRGINSEVPLRSGKGADGRGVLRGAGGSNRGRGRGGVGGGPTYYGRGGGGVGIESMAPRGPGYEEDSYVRPTRPFDRTQSYLGSSGERRGGGDSWPERNGGEGRGIGGPRGAHDIMNWRKMGTRTTEEQEEWRANTKWMPGLWKRTAKAAGRSIRPVHFERPTPLATRRRRDRSRNVAAEDRIEAAACSAAADGDVRLQPAASSDATSGIPGPRDANRWPQAAPEPNRCSAADVAQSRPAAASASVAPPAASKSLLRPAPGCSRSASWQQQAAAAAAVAARPQVHMGKPPHEWMDTHQVPPVNVFDLPSKFSISTTNFRKISN
ncbi:unnamed protein product [Nesidiocoris tenuis]|uniref:Uncharacterized protein n=1 Tax=Nesidiocoris tenuis TaxID=355587 RepID=A0A6H5G3A1_9HEMI|nr:unnamed protein product [Nesidiocoris tenuis]